MSSTQPCPDAPAPSAQMLRAPEMRHDGRMAVLDADWQFPAITEAHAFHRLDRAGPIPEGVLYLAFPWATLIDKLDAPRAHDRTAHLNRFGRFRDMLPRDRPAVTVCQHIRLRPHLGLFAECGVRDIYWSHATRDDLAAAQASRAADMKDAAGGADRTGPPDGTGIRLWPFPLYPVQLPRAWAEPAGHDRPYLFSFMGARPSKWYLTQIRAMILDRLAGDPRGLILGRDTWHYNKIVYDLQIRTTGAGDPDASKAPDTLVDVDASTAFRESLKQSLFSLCPSGSGPNSIRLWESLAAGAIPVILADTYAPPGPPELWAAATVRCAETEDAVEALPDRLAGIAADPARIAAMRHAMRQIWSLYGPDGFVPDVQGGLLHLGAIESVRPLARLAARPAPGHAPPRPGLHHLPYRMLSDLAAHGTPPDTETAARLVTVVGAAFLADPAGARTHLLGDPALRAALARARGTLPPDHPQAARLDTILVQPDPPSYPVSDLPAPPPGAGTPNTSDTLAAPPVVRPGSRPRICLSGRHAHRTPLSHPPLRALAAGRVDFTADPADADLIVTGYNIDLTQDFDTLEALVAARPRTRIAVISEEPLWDTIWSNGIALRDRTMIRGDRGLPYTALTHVTSSIFAFDRLPYFPLTDDAFLPRWRAALDPGGGPSAAELAADWRGSPIPAAFFLEKRTNPAYDRRFDDLGMAGLSLYRSDIAAAVTLPGTLRIGQGWTERAGPRQRLPDWHLDKLVTLTGRTRIAGAIENTHHRDYVSEKILDAFAIRAVPVYHAGPDHRVRDLVPGAAMIDVHGLDASAAAARIMDFTPGIAAAEAHLETRARLFALLSDSDAILAERSRIVDATLAEIDRLVGG